MDLWESKQHIAARIYNICGESKYLILYTSRQLQPAISMAKVQPLSLFNHQTVRFFHLYKYHLPFSKLTWQWKIPIFNREYIFNWSIFHCHVSLPEGADFFLGSSMPRILPFLAVKDSSNAVTATSFRSMTSAGSTSPQQTPPFTTSTKPIRFGGG